MGGLAKRTVSLWVCLALWIGVTQAANAATKYQFQRLWPALQQPWYFNTPTGVAIAPDLTLYVADANNQRIAHFTSDGRFIASWVVGGSANNAIAVAPSGDVYARYSDLVRHFSPNGELIREWNSNGDNGIGISPQGHIFISITSPTPHVDFIEEYDVDDTPLRTLDTGLSEPDGLSGVQGIAFDKSGNIYVAERLANRVSVLSPAGTLTNRWGTTGSSDGEFELPGDLGVYGNSLYVLDTMNDRIQEFTLSGTFVKQFGSRGRGDGQLRMPLKMAIKPDTGEIYVADTGSFVDTEERNERIAIFDSSGNFLHSWQCGGTQGGHFNQPTDIALGPGNVLFVCDRNNRRIQSFSRNGQLISNWTWDPELDGTPQDWEAPSAIAVDNSSNVYVSTYGFYETHNKLMKFTANGTYIKTIGHFTVRAVDIDADGNIWTLGQDHDAVRKYNSSGDLLMVVPMTGYCRDMDVAIDGSFYVIDVSDGVKRFNASGAQIGTWPSSLWLGNGGPSRLRVGNDGYGYLMFDTSVTIVSPAGSRIATVGNLGTGPGQFSPLNDGGIEVDTAGNIYTSEEFNNRIQVFKPDLRTFTSKAVIVAAGGPFPGNDLWNATEMNANFAYRALASQGYTKETIQYLSSETQMDLDGNGLADDVDGDCTLANLQAALAGDGVHPAWATQAVNGLPVEDVVVYLVDHGGATDFRMNATTTLPATTLASWVSTLDAAISGKVTVIIDACDSGSFLSPLSSWAAGAKSTNGRIVITSTSPGESAFFVNQGAISFSNYFWTGIFNGNSLGASYTLARNAMSQNFTSQHPLLDAGGNGTANEAADLTAANAVVIGNGVDQFNSAPVLGGVSPVQNINGIASASIFADPVTDPDGIARVFGVIRTPDFQQSVSGNPVTGLPTVELLHTTGNRYVGTYTQFTTPGTYNILVYATDRFGNTCVPRLATVNVANPLKERALIVVGGTSADPQLDSIVVNGDQSYTALKYQGFVDDDITYLAPVATAGVDLAPSLSNVHAALATSQHADTQDLLVYVLGSRSGPNLALNDSEVLTAAALKTDLDGLQPVISGKIVVVLDSDYSGGLLGSLSPPPVYAQKRIVITSTKPTQTAKFLQEGAISFSRYFWNRILNGASVYDAWQYGYQGIKYAGSGQTPMIDDDGNGESNNEDSAVARKTYLGAGILLAGDEPIIGSVIPAQTLSGTNSVTLWADPVTSTVTLDRVMAHVTAPDGNEAFIELLHNAGDRFESTYNGFTEFGDYSVTIYASDMTNQMSLPMKTTVTQSAGPDVYEVDDSWTTATLASGPPDADHPMAPHNFHTTGDEDWVAFLGNAGDDLSIATYNIGPGSDPILELYDTDGVTLRGTNDIGLGDFSAYLQYTIPSDGVYFVRVTNGGTALGQDTAYGLQVWRETGACTSLPRVTVTVLDTKGAKLTGAAVGFKKAGAPCNSHVQFTNLTNTSGETSAAFPIPSTSTAYYFQASKSGYDTSLCDATGVTLDCGSVAGVTIRLVKSGSTPQAILLPDSFTSAPNAYSRNFSVVNDGGQTLSWTVDETRDYPWLTLSNNTGTGDSDFTATFMVNHSRETRRAWLHATAVYDDGIPALGNGEEFYLEQLGDTLAPAITLDGDSAMTLYLDEAYVEPGFHALDNVDGDLTPQIHITGSVNVHAAGDYVLTYSVADLTGNLGIIQRTVKMLTCTHGICLTAEPGGPTTIDRYSGEDVSFSITVTGDPPITYQWYKDTGAKSFVEITGEMGSQLTLSNLQTSDSGQYYCLLQDADESVQGPTFTLNVTEAPHLPVAGGIGLAALAGGLLVVARVALRMRRRRD